MLNKTELRRRLMQNRRADPEKDKIILENLLTLKEFRQAELILTYVSTEKEIDTHELIKHCFKNNKTVAVPRTEAYDIRFYEINNFADLEAGYFGISEPIKTCKPAQITEKVFCVVPALACNKDGFRIGYGKGYYDKFLNEFYGKSAVLCYDDNIIELPLEAHDRAAWAVITDRRVIYGR